MADLSNKLNSAMNKKFLKNMVDSASPMQLVVILYDGAIQWLQMAKNEVEKNKENKPPNWSDFSAHMGKAGDILTHLQESLDFKQSEDFAQKMFDLYDFMKTTLYKANAYKNENEINEVIKLLKELKQSWQEALKTDNNNQNTAVA